MTHYRPRLTLYWCEHCGAIKGQRTILGDYNLHTKSYDAPKFDPLEMQCCNDAMTQLEVRVDETSDTGAPIGNSVDFIA